MPEAKATPRREAPETENPCGYPERGRRGPWHGEKEIVTL